MANNNYEKQINDSYQESINELEKENERILGEINALLKKSETQDLTVMDYYMLYFNYKLLQDKSKYKAEIEKYKNIILELMSDNTKLYTAEEYCCLSNLYFEEKLYDKCFENINIAIDLDPNSSEGYFIKGEFYRKLGKNIEAEIEYSKAIEIDPELSETINLLKSSDKLLKKSRNLRFSIYLLFFVAGVFIIYFIVEFVMLTIDTFFM